MEARMPPTPCCGGPGGEEASSRREDRVVRNTSSSVWAVVGEGTFLRTFVVYGGEPSFEV